MRRMSPDHEANAASPDAKPDAALRRIVPSPRAIFVSGTRCLFRLLPRQESFASLHIRTRRASEGSEASAAPSGSYELLGARVIDFGWMTGPRRLARRSSRLVSLILLGGFELSRRSRGFPEWTGGCARSQPARAILCPCNEFRFWTSLAASGSLTWVRVLPSSGDTSHPTELSPPMPTRGRTSSNPQP